MVRRRLLLALLFMLVNGLSAAQPHAPVVTMSVTLPDGRTQELTAPESGLATLQLKDGSEYGFRPTIQDSSPWNRIVVTIFRTATASAPTTVLGEFEVTRGGPAVESKTTPSFKVSVSRVSPPATDTEPAKPSTTRASPFLSVGGVVGTLTYVLGKPTVRGPR